MTSFRQIEKKQVAKIEKGDIYIKAYDEHNKILRTWLVAYGVGAPVLVLANPALLNKVLLLEHCKLTFGAFLFGIALQILVALINKYTMWICYYGENNDNFRSGFIYRSAEVLSKQAWVDFLCDIGAIGLMAIASLYSLNTLI